MDIMFLRLRISARIQLFGDIARCGRHYSEFIDAQHELMKRSRVLVPRFLDGPKELGRLSRALWDELKVVGGDNSGRDASATKLMQKIDEMADDAQESQKWLDDLYSLSFEVGKILVEKKTSIEMTDTSRNIPSMPRAVL